MNTSQTYDTENPKERRIRENSTLPSGINVISFIRVAETEPYQIALICEVRDTQYRDRERGPTRKNILVSQRYVTYSDYLVDRRAKSDVDRECVQMNGIYSRDDIHTRRLFYPRGSTTLV